MLDTTMTPCTDAPPPINVDLDDEILKILKSIVAKDGQDALNDITRKMIRDALEANLSMDLSLYKHQIKDSLALVLDNHPELFQSYDEPVIPAVSERTTKRKPGKAKKRKKPAAPDDLNAVKKPKSNTGINQPLKISVQLADLIGSSEPISRPQIVKKIWEYIKSNQLQDPADGRFILCDARLSELFGHHQRISAFAMQKYVSEHVSKLDPPAPSTASSDP